MTNKHTPGPWQVSAPEDEYDTWLVLCSAHYEVAHIARRYTNGERNEAIEVENARLIAAAPETAAERDRLKEINAELLAALEKIAEVCNGYDLEAGWACKTARAAIAKATGQALQDLADIGQELNI